jgi:hypothetical protein
VTADPNPYAQREAALDLLMIFGTTGLTTMLEHQDPDDTPDIALKLSGKLEWALRTAGFTVPELQASTIRVRAYAASVKIDDEFERLMGDGGFGSEL